MAYQEPEETDMWRNIEFRNLMIERLANEIANCPALSSNDPADLELQVYARATNRNGYLNSMARLLIYLQEMATMFSTPEAGAHLPATGLIGLQLDDDDDIQPMRVLDLGDINILNQICPANQQMQPGQQEMILEPPPEFRNELPAETPEDRAYREKVEELQIYVGMLQWKLEYEVKTDVEKRRLTRLLDILTNPETRVPMEVLLKCDNALKILAEREAERAMRNPAFVYEPEPEPEPVDDFLVAAQELQDAVLSAVSNNSFHFMAAFFQTLGTTFECLTGQPTPK